MLGLKHILTTLCLIITFQIASFAQQHNFEAIESEKMAYITKELRLTPAEAQRFFPIYNKYNEEMWDIKREKRSASSRGNSLNPKRDVIAFDAKEVEIKKKYRSEFSKVVGQARASQFFQVVEDFNDILRNTLQNRKNNGRRP